MKGRQQLDTRTKLAHELLQRQGGKIQSERQWGLPVKSLIITYELVAKTKMDVLMKMMLQVYQSLPQPTEEKIASLLFVDPLFIHALKEKLLRAKLLLEAKGVVSITEKGAQQLAEGEFTDAPELQTSEMYYSPFHRELYIKDDTDGEVAMLETFRYVQSDEENNISIIQQEKLIEAVRKLEVEMVEESKLMVVTQVVKVDEIETIVIPCYEFWLQHIETHSTSVHVWNGLTFNWDQSLEHRIEKEEMKQ